MDGFLNEVACSVKKKKITKDKLPLSCPQPDQQLWNAHPKVFLPIEESGTSICPYCGTNYILED